METTPPPHESCNARATAERLMREGEQFVHSLLPIEVVRHLAEAHRQVVHAGIRAGHLALRDIDARLARAEAMHRPAPPSARPAE